MNALTDDTLLGGRVKIRQPESGYRAAIDPVLLAAAVPAHGRERVIDVGCGTGAAMFCLAARVPTVDVTGLEIQSQLSKLAHESIALNGWELRARIMPGDLALLSDIVCAQPFDIVMTNPPFVADGTAPPDASVAIAHRESHLDLAAWIKQSLKLLKSNGRIVVIHRADRLSELLAALHPACGDIKILPIAPREGEPAKRVIVDAGKGRKSPDVLRPPLVLHGANGRFTPQADAVLFHAAALV